LLIVFSLERLRKFLSLTCDVRTDKLCKLAQVDTFSIFCINNTY